MRNKYSNGPQKTKFTNHCKKHSIDMTILNKLNDNTIYTITSNSIVFEFDNNPYCQYESGNHSYIFRFKDIEAYRKFLSQSSSDIKNNDYKFDYDEQETIINGHHLKTILFDMYDPNIYIFDEETKFNIISLYSDKVFVSRDMSKVINYYHSYDKLYKWTEEKEFPEELDHLIRRNQILISLK